MLVYYKQPKRKPWCSKVFEENEYGIYVENLEAYIIFNVKTLRGSIDENKIHIHALFTHVKHILYS